MNKWLKVGIILIVLILLFIPTIIAMKYVAISQIYYHFVDSVSNLTGLNKYLVKAGVVLMLVPFFIGLKLFFSIKKTRRYMGTSILLTLLILYNLSLYHFTKDSYFTFSEGKVLKWYALTPDGVKFFDSSGVDPVYGIPLKPVTPEVIRNLKLIQKGEFRPIDPKNVQFFNPITGEAQVWYYQYPDESLEFYDKPGYHPITGEQLKPATKQIYFEWQEKEKAKKSTEAAIQQEQAVGKSENDKDGKKSKEQQIAMGSKPPIVDEKERRLKEFKSLINKGVATYSDKPNVAIVIESKKTESGVFPENTFYSFLRSEKVNIVLNLFKEKPFKAKGYFKEIYEGNIELLRQADVLPNIDYLILGRLNYSFQKGGIDKDFVSCNINLSYKVISKKGNVVKVDDINIIGPGFSQSKALERGLELIAEKYSQRIIRSEYN